MSGSQIRALFFDLGNVLISLDTGKFVQKMESLSGLGSEQLRAGFAGDLVPRYECGLLDTSEFLEQLCGRLGVRITQNDFAAVWTCLFCEDLLVPENLIRKLARNYPLWALSNTNKMHFEFIRSHYRFLDYFQGWILSYEVGAAKPDPAIFLHGLERTGIRADEALFIDDQMANIEAARHLGIDSIHFESADALIDELKKRAIVATDE
jgi:putative hydrolase of the HAD superfamily